MEDLLSEWPPGTGLSKYFPSRQSGEGTTESDSPEDKRVKVAGTSFCNLVTTTAGGEKQGVNRKQEPLHAFLSPKQTTIQIPAKDSLA